MQLNYAKGCVNFRDVGEFVNCIEETTKEMGFAQFRNSPLVDGNGDGIANDREDLAALDGLFLNDPDTVILDPPPDILNWNPPLSAGMAGESGDRNPTPAQLPQSLQPGDVDSVYPRGRQPRHRSDL